MRAVAEATGGQFWAVDSVSQLGEVSHEIYQRVVSVNNPSSWSFYTNFIPAFLGLAAERVGLSAYEELTLHGFGAVDIVRQGDGPGAGGDDPPDLPATVEAVRRTAGLLTTRIGGRR